MTTKIDPKIAKKILSFCTVTVRHNNPKLANEYKGNPEKMIDESIAILGSTQWLDELKLSKDVTKEIGRIILDHIELEYYPESWTDMETGDGRLEIADRSDLIDWIVESVLHTLKVKV